MGSVSKRSTGAYYRESSRTALKSHTPQIPMSYTDVSEPECGNDLAPKFELPATSPTVPVSDCERYAMPDIGEVTDVAAMASEEEGQVVKRIDDTHMMTDHASREQLIKEETQEKVEAPLLYIDVNLGEEASERIIVNEGDTAVALAAKFCEVHHLDEET